MGHVLHKYHQSIKKQDIKLCKHSNVTHYILLQIVVYQPLMYFMISAKN